MIDFGKALRSAQIKKNITSTQLAGKFGVSRQQMHRWRHQTTASLSLVDKMCTELKMDEIRFLKLGRE
jgi:transcriptional regulator with XRE-family HTH domain